MGLFLFINVQWISVGSNRKNNALLASALDSQVSSYKEGLEHFSTDYRFLDALKPGNADAATQVNRLLYGFTTSQPIRSTFALTDTEGRMVSSSLFEGNREIFLNSAVYKSLVEKMQEAPDLTHTMPSRLARTLLKSLKVLFPLRHSQELAQLANFQFLPLYNSFSLSG